MGVREVQLTSKCHPENILASLHQLRLEGHLSDVTVQVDCEGEVQDFKAHQVMLAASSGYFKKTLLSQCAAQDKVLLSNMQSSDFSKFLEFVYTGKVQVHSDKIGDVHAMAEFLDCKDLVDVCSETMSAGVLQKRKNKSASSNAVETDNLHDAENVQSPKGKKQPKNLKHKEMLSPESTENSSSEQLQDKDKAKDERQPGRKAKRKRVDHGLPQTTVLNTTENTEDREDWAATEAEPEKGDKSVDMTPSEEDEWENKDNEGCDDPDDPLFLALGGEGEGEEEMEVENEEESTETVKRTSKAQLQCNKCQRTFHYERSYLKHISTYHGVQAEVIYRCETCQQTFANRSNLNTHEKHVHSTERLHACDNCPKTFKRKKDVVRHQKQVHERNYMYNVCSDCGKTLSSKAALLLHKRIHTGTKPYECAECGARFTQNSALKMHSRIHTGEKPFACDQCDSRFNQKHMLAYHKRSHTGEKPFMCEACGKSFASKEYLRHHSNIHTGSRPFKCDQCGRGFAQRNSLNQHLKIHTGERPYGCKFCEKQFTQLNALQRHQRIHTGEKPYMCGLCTRTFTDKSTLRRHTMIHDSEAPWKTYLVVLKGNVEDKPAKASTKSKTEKAGGEKKSTTKKKSAAATGEASVAAEASVAGETSVASETSAASAVAATKTPSESIVVAAEQVTIPSDWTSHGTIALVSHGALGGLAVIHTDMPPGTQIQPIMTTDGTGTSVLSLDGSTIPFSLPMSVAHHIPLSSEASSSTVALPTLSVPAPVSVGTLAPVSQTAAVCTTSVLEAVATQTVLAAESDSKSTAETDGLPPDIQTVIITDGGFVKEETAAGQIIKEPKETREAAGNACE